MKIPRKRKPRTILGTFQRDIRTKLVSGLLVVVPLGVTLLVLRFLYTMTAGFLVPGIRAVAEKVHAPLPDYAAVAISIFLLLSVLYLVGLVATVYVGRKIIGLAEAIMYRIPLVRTVYGASKQVVDAMSFQQQGGSFQYVVMVEFPRPGMLAIGFMTGSLRIEGDPRPYYRVFIPTTPNPTTGYFEIVAATDLFFTNLSVEEGVKVLMSGGIVAPESLVLTPGTEPPTRSLVEDQDGDDA